VTRAKARHLWYDVEVRRDSMKPGDIVAPKKGSYFHKRGHRWTGKVIDIQTWEETGSLTAENHGSINIELLTVENYYLKVGDEESYSYFGWESHLEVISEAR
jgi:hypothetical protein